MQRQDKRLGGLGIKNLEFFNKALRLRWLWQKWKQPDKPWVNLPLQFSEPELKLFRACTTIAVGNRQKKKKTIFGMIIGYMDRPLEN